MNPAIADPLNPEHPPTLGELKPILEGALRDAHFAARVDLRGVGSVLDLTVLSHKAPFDRTLDAANAWMASVGIGGTATFNDFHDIVVTLSTAAEVHKLTTALLEPHIRAHAVADELSGLLEAHHLSSSIELQGTHAVEVVLAGDELEAVAGFAAKLDAPAIEAGLALHRPRGMRRLAERLQWLVTGALGSAVCATATPGCAHDPDHITLHLTIDQAQRLTQRLPCPTQDNPIATCPVRSASRGIS
ncbi:hypothetical protein ABZ016_22870 [Streptomyces sp. NPDC006372]|uniref:hypothetical protein n=1 Tax=Streptomyces sp. NPDC006372 TaxID=3155599 RepID=UPI0033ACA0FA